VPVSPVISENQIKLIFGAVAAVCSFLLVQTDMALAPWANVVLGAIIVALAVLNPGTLSDRTTR
jgi:hypothetical protein